MNKRDKISLAAIVGLTAAVVVLIIVGNNAGRPPAGLYDDFAKCLAGKNITMYGSKSCVWCQKEKAEFGDSFRYVPYIECPAEPQKCLAAGIQGTPTWIFDDGRRLVGYQGLQKLSQASGCDLTK